MSLFTKKQKEKEANLQECEQEFSKLQFELGAIIYLMDLKTNELNKLSDQHNEILESMKKWANRGVIQRNKAKNELEETIKKGEKVESSLN